MFRVLRDWSFYVFFAFLYLARGATALEADPRIAALIEGITSDSLLEHVGDLVLFETRHASLAGGKAAQEHIRAFLSHLALDDVYLQGFDQERADNVVGVVQGVVHPERIHVIGAHYDSTNKDGGAAPGADDNASGTAAVLEAARVLSESGFRPAETIFFVAFSAEESGLLGSKAFVAELADQNGEVVDMICLDVIGYVKPGTTPDLSVSSSAFTPEINALIDILGEVAEEYLPSWTYESGPGCG